MTDTLFTNAKLIDPEGGHVTTGALAVTGGKISAIITGDTPYPEARETVDCDRKHLAPGIVDTPMMAKVPDEYRQRLEDMIPFPKRYSKPSEIAELVAAEASLDEVQTSLLSTGYPARRLRFVTADVRKNLHKVHTNLICLLRLDTDFFDSTYAELKLLYPRVSLNAPVIIDDYGHWKGCRDAVEQYFAEERTSGRHQRPHQKAPSRRPALNRWGRSRGLVNSGAPYPEPS